jgi:hypothetical protein
VLEQQGDAAYVMRMCGFHGNRDIGSARPLARSLARG